MIRVGALLWPMRQAPAGGGTMKKKSRTKASGEPAQGRRRFLGAACAGAGAVTLGLPGSVQARDKFRLRIQSTWPGKDFFQEYARDYVRKVHEMSGGRLELELFPATRITEAFHVIDAVSSGTLDGGHGVPIYWSGKHPATSLWGSGPAFGMDANMLLAWHHFGGGAQLLDEIYRKLGLAVTSFVYGPMPTQPLGWFKDRPVATPGDFKGKRFRAVGLAGEIFRRMGAQVEQMDSGEIVPALQRGSLDAAEFNNSTSDRILGFPDVARHCMLQSFHQSSEVFEILFNEKLMQSLPADLQAVLRYAAWASSAEMSWKAIDRYSRDYDYMREKQGVRFHRTPEAILKAQLRIWSEIIDEKSQDPLFRKVLDSQRQFARLSTRWHNDHRVDFRLASQHFFPDVPPLQPPPGRATAKPHRRAPRR